MSKSWCSIFRVQLTYTHLQGGGTKRKKAVTSKRTIHPGYNDGTLENDICILHFDEDLPLDKNHNMACLPNPSDQPAPGSECYIAGYGYQGESFPTLF